MRYYYIYLFTIVISKILNNFSIDYPLQVDMNLLLNLDILL